MLFTRFDLFLLYSSANIDVRTEAIVIAFLSHSLSSRD